MSKVVYIAEKPSLGRDIADALGGGQSRNGFIEGGDWIVTWVFGHVYGLVSPTEYDEKYKFWSIDNLPIIPEKMKLKVSSGAGGQISIIRKLLSGASSVVHAGDAGREGQLLIDEVLQELKYKGPVKRLWAQKMTKSGLQESISRARPNKELKGLSDAAVCRRDSDWLVGFNFSPLFTLVGQAKGISRDTQNIGRVMTPTLRMVVERDIAIENFKPKDFFELHSNFGNKYSGKWNTPDHLLDGDGYLTDKSIAESVKKEVEGIGEGEIVSAKYKTQSSAAPMPFTLPELQKYCNRIFGWSAKKTLGIAQGLYEKHKMTSYPRTETPYLAEEQFQSSAVTLKKTLEFMGREDLLEGANFNQKHAVFNDKKLGEHHAIIPTGESSGYASLTNDERQAFTIITLRFLAVFYPPKITRKLSIETQVDEHSFITNLNEVTDFGWEYMVKEGKVAKQEMLPSVSEGEIYPINSIKIESKKTSPPLSFTEDTLLSAMESAGRFVENEEDRDILKSVEGLGTPATRADIISKLYSPKLAFLQRKGKKIISTPKGRKNIEIAIDDVTSPTLTAEWEKLMKKIESGEMTLTEYESKIKSWITGIINQFKEEVDFKKLSGKSVQGPRPPSEKQLALAYKIAKDNGVSVPEKALTSSFEISIFIDTNIKKSKKGKGSSGKRPPSEKQLAFANKLSEQKKKKMPAAAKKDSSACAKFIDSCLKS